MFIKLILKLKLTKHDGSPVQDSKTPVTISSTYDNVEYTNYTKFLDQNGMAELEFYPPIDAKDSLKIEVYKLFCFSLVFNTNQCLYNNELSKYFIII